MLENGDGPGGSGPAAMRPIQRVLLVGAGVAGLSAAWPLVERGYEVVILEGRKRTGGRCHTEDGLNEGAHWIHTTDGNPITAAARALSVEPLFVGDDSSYSGGWEYLVLHGPQGVALTGEQKLHTILLADEIREQMNTLRRRVLKEGGEDLSTCDAAMRVFGQRMLEREDMRAVDWHLAVTARDDCAGGAERISLLW